MRAEAATGCRRLASHAIWAGALATLFLAPAADAADPKLNLILPRGVQRGGDRELTFQGERLGDAEEIVFYGHDGLNVRLIQPVDAKSFKAVIHVPETCPPGEQVVQVRTRSGISELRTFVVGELPIVDESEPNNTLAKAQPVPLGTTVHGVVTNEDIDSFAVELRKGQRFAVEVEGMRLGSAIVDTQVSVIDAKGRQIAAADDTAATLQDPFLSLIVPEDGRYVVRIREAAYGGSDAARYRLHVGAFPRPTAVYPAGGRAGDKTKVTFLGDAAGPIEREIDVPAAPVGKPITIWPSDDGGTSPSGFAFRLSADDNLLEQEPNDGPANATSGAAAQAFNGVIDKPGDVDHFRFAARKGQVLDIDCFARRLHSGLDPVINLLKADGSGIASNDDSRGLDAHVKFTAPADGDYLLRITDHLGRGRPDFVYRVELREPSPALSLSIPRPDRNSQARQTVTVARGNRAAILVNATRTDFDGDLLLAADGLPPGLTMAAPLMQAGRGQVAVIFEAAADAPLAGCLLPLEARRVTPEDPQGTGGLRGRFTNTADLTVGDPGNAVYHTATVDRLAVAVADALPLRVDIVPPRAPIVRKGSMHLKVMVTRGEGFTGPVTVEFPFRPQGLAGQPSITIPPDKTEGLYEINADEKAATGTWPVHVIAAADVGGTAWVASAPVQLEIAEPFTLTEIKRATVEQGKSGAMRCKLTPARPFEGEATARLVGLPGETTADELKFTKDTTELVFEVKTTGKGQVGLHRSVFVEVVTPVNGEDVRMTGDKGEVKILAPNANPAAQVAK